MPEFGDAVGPFISNLIRSLEGEAEHLPPLMGVAEALRDFDPSPERITEFAAKCADAVTAAGKVLADLVQGARESSQGNEPMPDNIDIPDDLSGLQ